MLQGHTDDRRNAGWWRALAWALAALAGLASGFVASLLSPLIACFCCGPFGGVLSGAAACAAPPGASRSEASRVSALGGLAYGVGAWIGLALAIALGLATGAVQQAQREFLRRLGGEASPETETAGLAIGIALVLCLGAVGLLLISAAGGWLGGKAVQALRGREF